MDNQPNFENNPSRFGSSLSGGPNQVSGSQASYQSTTQNTTALKPASFWKRLVATMIDGFVLNFAMSIVMLPVYFIMIIPAALSAEEGGEPPIGLLLFGMLLMFGIMFGCMFFYYGWFYSRKGATPGKMVLSLRVVNANTGENLSMWRAFFRETIGKMISGVVLYIGFLMAGFREDGKALHDVLFDSQVLENS